ncbi:MAG TPA: hypothetical protein VGY66_27955 [Gemmataceae bacterium]|jgi:hypothetical protein|nr:hypothetical protein [Gemmataceae bacterium]
MSRRLADGPARTYWGYCAGVMLLAAAIGCGQPAPGGNTSIMAAADEAAAPKGNAIADPVLREARDEADEVLHGLLAGKFDQDENLAVVAEKVKGYTSWSVRSQKIVKAGMAEFQGMLSSPAAKATFTMLLVKQTGGPWAVSMFSGPYPK